MKKWTFLVLFTLVLFGNSASRAQTLVLNPENHRFLINEPGQRPRLDLIIRNFTSIEKRNLGTTVVMDTVTNLHTIRSGQVTIR